MPSRADDDNPKVKEFLSLFPEGRVEDGVVLQMTKWHKGPRIIKTHLQIDLLNPDLLDTCKVCASSSVSKDGSSARALDYSDSPSVFSNQLIPNSCGYV